MAISKEARLLLIESWTLYGFAILFVSARMASKRILLGSWRKCQIDDYIMLAVVLMYTGVTASLNVTAQNLSNYLPEGAAEEFTPQEIGNAVYGSKFVFATEHLTLAVLWSCKACLLILYSQITQGLPKQHRFVKIVAGYCVFGWAFSEILFMGLWCHPVQQYWQVPVDNPQCASYYHHLIVVSVFNISSDLIMLLIPLPLLIKARLPLKRKLVLCVVFSLGIFVVLAAILNRYFNFTEPYGSLVYLNWYAGETSTAIMVSNIPHCWPILSRIFKLGAFKNASRGPNSSSKNRYFSSGASRSNNSNPRSRRREEHGYIRSGSESEERIANAGTGPGLVRTPASGTSGSGGLGHGQDIELGKIDQMSLYIGTAVTAGTKKKDGSWDTDGTIVKTVSMNQTYSEQSPEASGKRYQGGLM